MPGQTYEISFDYNFTQGSLQYYFYLNNTLLEGFSSSNISGSGSYSALHTIGEQSGQGFNMMDSFVFTVDNGPLTGTIDNIVMKLVPSIGFYPKTISYNEDVKGWTSFKSFTPLTAVSLTDRYFSVNDNTIWRHHSDIALRNNFYGTQYNSEIEVLFNDQPGAIKSFKAINYEGTQAKITQFTTSEVTDAAGNTATYNDSEYYNLSAKSGWYVDDITTDKQSGNVHEFIEKEGKWFNKINGDTTTESNLDTSEFSVQGIGFPLEDPEETQTESQVTIQAVDSDGENL